MIRVMIDGQVLEGDTALDVIRAMRASASPWQQDGSLARYMERVADRFQIFGLDVHADGASDAERADKLLAGMLACGYAHPQ